MAQQKLPAGFFRARRRRGSEIWQSDVVHFRLVVAGQRLSFKGYTDLRATQKLAADLRRQIERAAEGEPLQTDDASPLLIEHLERLQLRKVTPRKSLTAHLDAWKQSMLADGGGEDHAGRQKKRAKKIISGCGFRVPGDIQPEAVKRYLHRRRTAGGTDHAKDKRFGIQTSNHHLTAIKCFCNHLVRVGALAKNPLVTLAKLNVDVDVRKQRAAFATAELEKLLKHLGKPAPRKGPKRKISHADRRMIYLLATTTGLRASELASLTPNSFSLDATPPVVACQATISKRRRHDVLPLRGDVVALLRPYLAGKDATARLWRGVWYRRAAEMLALDLREADVPLVDAKGVARDFHCLRHTFITNVGKSGASPKVQHTLARHSTYTLTARYSHATEAELVAAVEALEVC